MNKWIIEESYNKGKLSRELKNILDGVDVDSLIDVAEKAYNVYKHDFRYVYDVVRYFLNDLGFYKEPFIKNIAEIINDYFVEIR